MECRGKRQNLRDARRWSYSGAWAQREGAKPGRVDAGVGARAGVAGHEAFPVADTAGAADHSSACVISRHPHRARPSSQACRALRLARHGNTDHPPSFCARRRHRPCQRQRRNSRDERTYDHDRQSPERASPQSPCQHLPAPFVAQFGVARCAVAPPTFRHRQRAEWRRV